MNSTLDVAKQSQSHYKSWQHCFVELSYCLFNTECQRDFVIKKMPGCCVPNCKNRSETGFRLFGIPTGENNEERRRMWLKFINRDQLPPRASICEAHFEESQFENHRADNRKLLKWTAVPTIHVETYQSPFLKKKIDHCNVGADVVGEVSGTPSACVDKEINNVSEREDDAFITNAQYLQLKNKLKNAYSKINMLEHHIKEMEEKYSKIFNKDQINFIANGSQRGNEWSDESIEKGLKLYMTCGTRGYQEILKQNLPYPSVRTLQHRIQHIKLELGILDKIFDLLGIK